MGKVISTFNTGLPGTISRAVDDIVTSYAYNETEPLAFGVPVILNTSRNGVRKFGSGAGTDDFIGISVRSASKTPDTYGSNEAQYNKGEMADILVRGCIVVKNSQGPAQPGGQVYVRSSGEFSGLSQNGSEVNTKINARFKTMADSNNLVEIVVTERAL